MEAHSNNERAGDYRLMDATEGAKDPTVLVTGAGGGGSNNLIRGLRKMGYDGKIVGTNISRYYNAKSIADENYHIPRGGEDGYLDALNRVIEVECVDLVIPNNGTEVREISRRRDEVNARTFLPPHRDIELCQDKLELTEYLRERGISAPVSRAIHDLDDIPEIFNELDGETLWLRMRHGSGSKGATKVKTVEQAHYWIKYWEEMRGIERGEFTLCEYLPGRDYAFQSIWKSGELVLSKHLERLSYYGGDNRASGQSSTPQVGKLLYDDRVQKICEEAIRAVNNSATGMYSIDLKEDADGNPYVTEINIGRFCMITNAFNEVGNHNMADLYIQLAHGQEPSVENPRRDIGDETTYLVRELDTEPLLITENHLEESYVDLTT